MHKCPKALMLHAPGHTQVRVTLQELDKLKSLLHSIDKKNNSSFDALHAKIVGISEEAGSIRGEIASIREDFQGMGTKLDAILRYVQEEANRSIFE
jgi:hypothetical protein